MTPVHTLHAPSGADYIWASNAPKRNAFVSFVMEFESNANETTCIHLFADTRFRLFVNEQFIAYGPARFVTQFPEYDTFALEKYLQPGKNTLRVEVNFYGSSSYQSMPDGQPGFIAWGGNASGTISFVTPGKWSAHVHQAWDTMAPVFSFAQNPAEICDTRLLEKELNNHASLPISVDKTARPWGQLNPRTVPYPTYELMRPARLSAFSPIKNTLKQIGCQTHDSDQNTAKRVGVPATKKPRRSFITWIHSTCEQTLELHTFWSELSLNETSLSVNTQSSLRGNHGTTQLSLKSGWNCLSGNFEILTEFWAYLLAWSDQANVSFHALPNPSVTEPWLLSPLTTDTLPTKCSPEPSLFTVPQGWEADSGDIHRVTPARLIAWDIPDESIALRNLSLKDSDTLPTQLVPTLLWSFDFEAQYYGHPVIEVEAPAGTILDLSYDDWKRKDGCTALYSSNPFTDAADRFILKGGRQRIEVFNPRGGIYLQVIARLPIEAKEFGVHLHSIGIRSRQTLEGYSTRFTVEDAVFNWAFEKSLKTLSASTDEAYSDCPWRERSSYIGDTLVNVHLHALVSHDMSIARRTLRTFVQSQLPTGQYLGCAPSWIGRGHADFSLLLWVAIRDYWEKTGDSSLALESWHTLPLLLNSSFWETHESGLWNANGVHLFVDWGCILEETQGQGNACLNLFRYHALLACAELAKVLNKPQDHAYYRAEANRIKTALEETLWLPEQGRFAAFVGADTTALHANILALRFGVGNPNAILEYLLPQLESNFESGISATSSGHKKGQSHCELYFMFYLFEALAELGQYALVESMIDKHYGFLKSLGYPTLNECFARADANLGSCCHSWSGAPAIYIHRHLVGLKQREKGNPNHWLLEPHTSRHKQVTAQFPHADGMIEIEWEQVSGQFKARVNAPQGVTIQAGANTRIVE